MTAPRHIAVIDVGKSNAKLALVAASDLRELAVVTRPNRVLPGPPWPHFDLQGHWQFFLRNLGLLHARHRIDAIAVTTHGAACVLLDRDGELAAPMLDYEHPGPDALAAQYEARRPPFSQTGSPRLPGGLNAGAQLHWMLQCCPGLRGRLAHVLSYPQYWGFRLTGALASDVCSLGCHTDLWNPWERRFSSLVADLGLTGKIAPGRGPAEVLGTLLPGVAAATGLPVTTPVACGIHDSNASLYPYVLGLPAPFAVVSTGTWVVAMAVGGSPAALDPARDVLVNVSAAGEPVPSARFMGGREYEIIAAGASAQPTAAERAAVLAKRLLLLPAVVPGSGPFAGRQMRWTAAPASTGERLVALGHYLALMTDTCLGLTGATGPVIVEGPFTRNADFLAMLAALRPAGVSIATSATGTSAGAALLCLASAAAPATCAVAPPPEAAALRALAARWRRATA